MTNVSKSFTYKHIHTCLTALFPGLPGWAGTRKVKPIWILLKQETVSGSGISWATCKSVPRSRQITTSAPHHSVFYRPDALPAAQPTASKHWTHWVLPTKWWRKPADIDMERIYVSVTLCIAAVEGRTRTCCIILRRAASTTPFRNPAGGRVCGTMTRLRADWRANERRVINGRLMSPAIAAVTHSQSCLVVSRRRRLSSSRRVVFRRPHLWPALQSVANWVSQLLSTGDRSRRLKEVHSIHDHCKPVTQIRRPYKFGIAWSPLLEYDNLVVDANRGCNVQRPPP